MIKRMNNESIGLEEILKEVDEPREIIRVTVSLSKIVFDEFKKRCGDVPVSRAINKILEKVIED